MARPSKYQPSITPELAKWMCRAGLTNEEIAAELGIAESTLYNWRRKHDEFAEALRDGKEYADAQVEDSLFRMATGNYEIRKEKTIMGPDGIRSEETVQTAKPNVTAAIFWLKNRLPHLWRDTKNIEHSGEVATRHEEITRIEAILQSDEQAQEALRQLHRRYRDHGSVEGSG